jgi:hypothetical protein
MAKEAASRSLDYSLSGDVLDRVAKAGRTPQPETGLGDAISGVGKTIKEYGEEKIETLNAGEEAWDEGFAKWDDRGAWASPELFDQFQTSEAAFREPYIEAIRSGDTKTASKLLKDQQTRSSQLAAWKTVMETAKGINEPDENGVVVGWSNSLSGDEKNALNLIAGGSAPMSYKDGEMVFQVGDKYWTRREVDEAVANGAYAHDVDLDILKDNTKFQTLGQGGGLFDFETQRGSHHSSLKQNPSKVRHILHNEIVGVGSFREHFKEELTRRLSSLDPTPEDGFTEEDINGVFKRWEENPAEAVEYQAEWLALSNQSQYNVGQKAKKRDDAVKNDPWKGANSAWQTAASEAGVQRNAKPTPAQYARIFEILNPTENPTESPAASPTNNPAFFGFTPPQQ